MTHPAIGISPERSDAWDKYADDTDFFYMLGTLAALYAKRKYDGKTKPNDDLLFKDFKQWRDDRLKQGLDAIIKRQ